MELEMGLSYRSPFLCRWELLAAVLFFSFFLETAVSLFPSSVNHNDN